MNIISKRLLQQSVKHQHYIQTLFGRNMSSSLMEKYNRVLSIQSHVVHGYVGNKSATFPLQVLGFEVDPINSVQLSNHTGYKHIKGQILHQNDLAELWEGLALNNLHNHYTHLLTGYVGSEDFLRQIGKMIRDLRKINPNLIFVCDPVMGDEGEMYVPKSLLPIYRDEIVPLADIATPNQFEVELLTGKKMSCELEAWDALEWFHEVGVKTVALSSTDFSEADLHAYISHKQKDGKYQRYRITIPRQGGHIHFTGTGDLFAALFLAHSQLCEGNMGMALEKSVNSLQAVIKHTLRQIPEDVRSGKVPVTSDQRELKIVQSIRQIENPVIDLLAEKC